MPGLFEALNKLETINEYKFDKTKDSQLLEYFKVYKEEIQNTYNEYLTTNTF